MSPSEAVDESTEACVMQGSSSGHKATLQFSMFSLYSGSTLKSHLSPSRALCHHHDVFIESSKAHRSSMIRSVAVTCITHRKCGREVSAAPRATGWPYTHTHTHTHTPNRLKLAWTGSKTFLHASAPQKSTGILYTRPLHVRTGSLGLRACYRGRREAFKRVNEQMKTLHGATAFPTHELSS